MTPVELNKVFNFRIDSQVPAGVCIPNNLFTYINDNYHRLDNLEDLGSRVQGLDLSKIKLAKAEKLQTRDRFVAALFVLLAVALVALMIFGFASGNPVVGIVALLALLYLGSHCGKKIDGVRTRTNTFTGLFRYVDHLWNKVSALKTEQYFQKGRVEDDLSEAGRFLRDNLQEVSRRVHADLEACNREINRENRDPYFTQKKKNTLALINELVEAETMVIRMKHYRLL